VENERPAGWFRYFRGIFIFKSFIKSNSGLDADQFSDRLLDVISGWSGRGLKGSLDDDLTLLVVDFETAAT